MTSAIKNISVNLLLVVHALRSKESASPAHQVVERNQNESLESSNLTYIKNHDAAAVCSAVFCCDVNGFFIFSGVNGNSVLFPPKN